jgi:hypothetical protein
VGWDWVHLVRRPLIGLLYQSRMMDECGAFGGMRIGKENRSTRRKPAPVPLSPPQIPNDLGSNPGRRSGKPGTNPWAMARPQGWVSVRLLMSQTLVLLPVCRCHCRHCRYCRRFYIQDLYWSVFFILLWNVLDNRSSWSVGNGFLRGKFSFVNSSCPCARPEYANPWVMLSFWLCCFTWDCFI